MIIFGIILTVFVVGCRKWRLDCFVKAGRFPRQPQKTAYYRADGWLSETELRRRLGKTKDDMEQESNIPIPQEVRQLSVSNWLNYDCQKKLQQVEAEILETGEGIFSFNLEEWEDEDIPLMLQFLVQRGFSEARYEGDGKIRLRLDPDFCEDPVNLALNASENAAAVNS